MTNIQRTIGDFMMSRKPLEPDAESVERQYGEEAELYAQVRADTAAAMGRQADARAWKEIEEDVDREEEGDGDRI